MIETPRQRRPRLRLSELLRGSRGYALVARGAAMTYDEIVDYALHRLTPRSSDGYTSAHRTTTFSSTWTSHSALRECPRPGV